MAGEHSNRGAKRAREARATADLSSGAPLNDVLGVVESAGAHGVILELPDGIAGAYVAKPGCPLLFVNGRQAVSRQRFTLAHEFGHHYMRHTSIVDTQENLSGYSWAPNEVAANAFAAEFLLPRAAVKRWAAEHAVTSVALTEVVELAYDYGVSAQVARYALEGAGILTDRARAETVDAEIADELHVELAHHLDLEPLDDELARVSGQLPRIPRTLRQSALGQLLIGGTTVTAVATRIGCEPPELSAALRQFQLDQLLPADVELPTAAE